MWKYGGILCCFTYLLVVHITDACPSDVSEYKEAIANLNCTGNLYGHCLRDEAQKVILKCASRSWVQPGFCPEYNSEAKKIDVFLCKESLGKCPDDTFWSNELYKYPSCLKEVSAVQISTPKPKLSTAMTTIATQGEPMTEERKTGSGILLLSVILPIAAVVVIVIIVVVILRFRRRNSGQGRKQEEKDEEIPLRAQGQGRKPNEKDEEKPLRTQGQGRNQNGKNEEKPLRTQGQRRKQEEKDERIPLSAQGVEKPKYHPQQNHSTGYLEKPAHLTPDIPHLSALETKPKCVSSREVTDEEICTMTKNYNAVLLISETKEDANEISTRIFNLTKCKIVQKFKDYENVTFESETTVLLQGFVEAPDAKIMNLFMYDTSFDKVVADIEEHKIHVIIPIVRDVWDERKTELKKFKLFQDIHEWKL